MKSRYWILLIALLLALCLGISGWLLLSQETADRVEIWSDGTLLKTLSLTEDTVYTVQSQWGTNVITVKGGKVAVTEATCPDKHCMHRGYQDGGMQIVCLPNRLVIQFVKQQEVDGVVG